MEEKIILDSAAMERALTRISYEIIEKNKGTEDLCIVGIQRRGESLAKIIADKINKNENCRLNVGTLDITLYRDDLTGKSKQPVLNGTDINFPIENKKVILVDDVLYTGRTCRAAIDALMAIGRPSIIQLAVLIDRGHRELPIRADYVGKNLPTSNSEIVKVHIGPFDDTENVTIEYI